MRRVLLLCPLIVVLFVNHLFAQAPQITSITPAPAVAGQQVTITGTNFGSTSYYVVFGSIAYPWVSGWTNTQIVTTVPSNAQSAPVYILNSSGGQSNSVNLTVVYPSITGISPTTVMPGQQVTITGTNFGSASGTVMFGSIAYPWVSSWSNTQIVTTVPANALSAPVYVQNPGDAQSNSVSLTVVYPNITSISPTAVGAGQQVTITGTNFGSTSGTVMFGSIAYPWVTSWTNTQIVVPVPSNAQSGPVYIQNSGGAQSNSVNLAVTGAVANPSPTSLTFTSQAVGATSGAQTITLSNTGNAALTLTSIALTGTSPGDFAQTNTCGSSVAAGANCTISVTFTPAAAGTFTAAVTLSDNATGSPQTVSLSGTGVAAAPVITSATTASVRVGSTVSYQIAATSTPTSYGATGLPAGLTVNSTTGLISGTPTSTGTSTVTLSATNAAGTGTATLTLTIAAPLPAPFVQIIANKNRATPTSQSLSFPANTLVGDLILVAFGYDVSATASVSDSQGNLFTTVGSQMIAPGGQYGQVYYATNIKGGADTVTVTLSANSAYLDLYLTEYSGINPTNPIDVQASASGTGGTVSSGNATTTVAGDVIYGYCVGAPVCTGPGSGLSARTTFDGNLIEDMVAGSAGSYAATGSATGGWAMQMVALKPAAVPSPVITSATTASGTTGSAFSYQITATNTPSSYGAAGLPTGLTVNSATGLISGTPTAAGTSTVTLSATNSGGTGTATLTLTINLAPPVITSAATKSGTVGSAFSYQITATNTPTSYEATGLPAGLTVNSATGLISGTPTAAGTSTVTVGATNSGGTGTATLTLTINLAPPVITSTATASGTTGSAFSYQITATNTPTSYGATGLPAGLTVTNSTGLISGTPAAAGTSTVTLSATNAGGTGTATLTLAINLAPPVITSATTASGTTGSAFSYQITATNTPTSYGATGLPAGLIVTSSTGLVSGTPSAAGTSTVTLSATNAGGTGTATLTLAINLAPPVITSATTASGTTGSAFSYQITATNTPTSYGATGLPAGLIVTSSTGLISGTPSAAGTSTVTLSATNAGGTGTATLTLAINLAPPVITSATTASGTTGSAFSYQITATNTPTSYGATGLPAGLIVTSSTGLISGTPSAGGTSAVTLSATNAGGTGTATMTLTLTLAAPVITSATTASVRVGSTVSYQIAATSTPTSYGATGLPAGLTVNSTTGLISGSPTSTGTSTVTLSATNAAGTGTATLTLTIAAPLPAPFVQIIANKNRATPTSQSLSFPANTLVGDLILVAFGYDVSATASVSDSQGNIFTAVGSQMIAPGGQYGQVYYAPNIKGGADTVTVTLSANSAYLDLYLTEYSGINPTNPIDVQASASGTGGTVSSGNATTTVSGDVIYGYCLGSPVCTPATGSAFTTRSTFDGNVSEDMLAGNAGSYAATGSATGGWAMQMVALKPALGGTVTAPVASLSPGNLTFASQAVGVTSAAQTVMLSNTGNAALSLTSIALMGTNPSDFAQTNNCGSSLAAGANCTISVTFTPTATGTRTAAVTSTDNATSSPQTATLSGTGTAPVASLSSSGLTFGNEPVDTTSSPQSVTLDNTGSTALSITSIAFTGANPTDFAENNTCGSSLPAGGTCTIAISFTPAASGAVTASLSITDSASGSPQSVALSGTGTHDVVLTWTASPTTGIAGYNVYRGTSPGGESSTPLNSTPINGITYVDENVTAGTEYYYVVMAVASNDVTLSAASNEVPAKVPSP